MRQKILIVSILLIARLTYSQSPHGDDFNVNCAVCHTADEWDLVAKSGFDHDTTSFKLTGQHKMNTCRQCHTSLVFKDAGTECMDCHTDIHQNTVGQSCEICHNTTTWIVSDISEVHEMSRFPLTGAHNAIDCYSCHPSASFLQFNVLGIDCYSCHQKDYQATTNPDHSEAGYSTQCEVCHSLHSTEWNATGFEHGFFPLIQGHSGVDCITCHGVDKPFQSVTADCYECHASDYEMTQNPNHPDLGFSQNCKECHTLAENWNPADYREHDNVYFPIYSGKHKNVWNSCVTCHNDSQNYSVFTCTDCHEHNKSAMDRKHDEVRDYSWVSNECYRCHPIGRADD
ncbi:hypothetical protein ACE01N_01030 [Saccharicrinis sp. FJH2]|uniref:hypothetical protein n=1 Tax=Saccharicrinis sp. FJH65 TaxID=3344659 RepID=UPI0035F2860E